MAKYKFKLSMDEETILRAKADRFDDFTPLFNELKKKFGEGKRKR